MNRAACPLKAWKRNAVFPGLESRIAARPESFSPGGAIRVPVGWEDMA
jgi:hypothetical protein